MDNIFSGHSIKKLLGNAQKMQSEMEDAQKSLSALRVVGSAGAGMVRVTMNGERKVLNIDINDDKMNDKDMLQDLIAAAVNDALQKAESEIQEKMCSLAGLLGKSL